MACVPDDCLVEHEIYYSTSDHDTTVDDCSVISFPEISPLSPPLLLREQSSFSSSFQMEDYYNDELMPIMTTPRKRKRGEETADDWSIHSFTNDMMRSPIKTPTLFPKKAIKLGIATPSSVDRKVAAASHEDDDDEDDPFHDPLRAMPLEIVSGFDTLLRPNMVPCKVATTIPETPTFSTPTKKSHNDKGNDKKQPPQIPTAAAASPNDEDFPHLPFPDLEIYCPKPMLAKATTSNSNSDIINTSGRRLLFPPVSPFHCPLPNSRSKKSHDLLQVAPKWSPLSPLPKHMPILPAPSPPRTGSLVLKTKSPFLQAVAFKAIASPVPSTGLATARPAPAAVTPNKDLTLQNETPKPKPKRGRPKKGTPKETEIQKEPPKKKRNTSNKTNRYRAKQEDKWQKRYEEAKAFIEKHGHGKIPNAYSANPKLGGWAKRQRYQYQVFVNSRPGFSSTGKRVSAMSTKRIELLDKIGFCWQHKTKMWEEQFQNLLKYMDKYGHAAVPTTYVEDQSLSGWVKVQRRQYKLFLNQEKSSMTLERIHRLNRVGFYWSIKDALAPQHEETETEKSSSEDDSDATVWNSVYKPGSL
ncbi:MAG: hypothetical protein SGBAC_006136 [Bacillariaceae sp.]